MNKCIYTRLTDTEATFDSEEHVFPNCIGGTVCLPKGYVSDKINNAFSKLELPFARENPIVLLNRMFSNYHTGRKHHTNRDKITVFDDGMSIMLGYVYEGKPISLNQIIFHELNEDSVSCDFKVTIKLSPNKNNLFAILDA